MRQGAEEGATQKLSQQCATARALCNLQRVQRRAQGRDAVLKSLDAWEMKSIYE